MRKKLIISSAAATLALLGWKRKRASSKAPASPRPLPDRWVSPAHLTVHEQADVKLLRNTLSGYPSSLSSLEQLITDRVAARVLDAMLARHTPVTHDSFAMALDVFAEHEEEAGPSRAAKAARALATTLHANASSAEAPTDAAAAEAAGDAAAEEPGAK